MAEVAAAGVTRAAAHAPPGRRVQGDAVWATSRTGEAASTPALLRAPAEPSRALPLLRHLGCGLHGEGPVEPPIELCRIARRLDGCSHLGAHLETALGEHL